MKEIAKRLFAMLCISLIAICFQPVYADAENIALLIEALKSTGLTNFQISIGDADYYKGICEEVF